MNARTSASKWNVVRPLGVLELALKSAMLYPSRMMDLE
jgi:hypothetical protein